jgi:CDP-diacylglycerol--glycerol-3-phosphate 3-phosphatidyltransferase
MTLNTLPNWLTFLRILALPALILLTLSPGRILGVAAALLFSAAAITDLLDGYIARKTGQVSSFGKLVDPIADKILVSTAFIMLVHLQRVPAWMVALIIAREFAVSGLRAYAGTQNIVIAADFSGKVKTTLQILAIIALLINRPFLGFPFRGVGWILLIAAFVATMWSGFRYFADYASDRTLSKGEGSPQS